MPGGLEELIAHARAACPEVPLDEERFRAHLQRHLGAEETSAWPRERAGDLWLACACASGSPEAVAVFEARFRPVVEQVLKRLRIDGDRASEVKQLVRSRLLVAETDKEPRIAGYSGRGDLAGWVRAATTRVTLNLIRDEPRARSGELLDRLPAATDDPELQMLKGRYAGAFREAFSAALKALTTRRRMLLKQHYIDGLSMEEMATLYQVHRVTVLRWISEAREAVAHDAEARLGSSLQLPKRELESLVRLVRSCIDVSLHDLLQPAD